MEAAPKPLGDVIALDRGDMDLSDADSIRTSIRGVKSQFIANAKPILGTKVPRLILVPTSEYPLPARRPADSRLDNSKLIQAFGLTPPAWNAMLKQRMGEITAGK
jgi:dTDP-4-dehydrorhamnose reductase